MAIAFGRDICGDLPSAETREWLVTNGIGGYASGTIAGLLTRRYHGLLVAALKPPLDRVLLLVKLDETARYDGQTYPLHTNRWQDGTINPHGYRHIERFTLDGTFPTWYFACADALLEKRIWMQHGANTTYVRYHLQRASQPISLTLCALIDHRDYHGNTHRSDWPLQVDRRDRGLCVTAYPNATPIYLLSDRAVATPARDWYFGFDLAAERYRGLSDCEDHLQATTFEVVLNPGESVTFVASTETDPSLDSDAELQACRDRERNLISLWQARSPHTAKAPDWIRQLILSADQFICDRPTPSDPDGKTILAGYPWFSDWGRDSMISLAGLTLVTGRPEIARSLLRTYAHFVSRGMLPNRFPDDGETPEYNTVDATLWYFEAIRAYVEATRDTDLLAELFPVLTDIVDWHCRGTRYGIARDAADGLLYAGETGVQLTWMDAKVDDWVVTPRIGKPVEVNALWYNALRSLADLARSLGKPDRDYQTMADLVLTHFHRFWNEEMGYCYDVIDGSDGNDPSLRPNQLFAVSLSYSPLAPYQQKVVVDICARKLLTSHGLRSLSPDDPRYCGRYGGDRWQRDGAYHQGTVWGWLLGSFVRAHLKVYRNPAIARTFLEPMAQHLTAAGIGRLSEIFDGDPPMTGRGCIAQSWTVAEVLRSWQTVTEFTANL